MTNNEASRVWRQHTAGMELHSNSQGTQNQSRIVTFVYILFCSRTLKEVFALRDGIGCWVACWQMKLSFPGCGRICFTSPHVYTSSVSPRRRAEAGVQADKIAECKCTGWAEAEAIWVRLQGLEWKHYKVWTSSQTERPSSWIGIGKKENMTLIDCGWDGLKLRLIKIVTTLDFKTTVQLSLQKASTGGCPSHGQLIHQCTWNHALLLLFIPANVSLPVM